ncbi:MAG: HDOD domain-containing protein [Proteobacteria bacterium]|nr:HDOD domain-containing protein [Pseudomonadota bacterium]
MDRQDPLIQKIQVFIDRMPCLSTTASKVLEVCNSPRTSANDLNRVISLDPILTGNVLKLINSAYYSSLNQNSSLVRAIIMLGLNTVKNLALSTAVIGAFGKKSSFTTLPMDAFWAHSIGVGVTAKAMAVARNVLSTEREEYFVAGMLHDLGKIPLNTCFSENYGQALQLAALEQNSLLKAEQLLVGVDHGVAGRLIGEKWRLGPAIIEALAHHHAPEQALDEHRDLVATVALANLYANIYKIGSAGDLHPENTFLMRVLEIMGLKWDDLQPLQAIVNSEIDKAQAFLNLTEREMK